MKILLVNNYFGNFGGAENSTFRTGKILQQKGHEIYYFAVNKSPFFIQDYEYAHFFPEYVNYNGLSKLQLLKHILRPFYNIEAEQKLDKYLKKIKPDIVHLNCIIYHLSPSVINACNKNNIPVIMTVRDPFLVCPNSALMINAESYCKQEICIKGNPIFCVLNKCTDNSFINSFISTSEFLFRQIHGLFNKIPMFICTSEATLNLLKRARIEERKLICINNFIDDSYFKIHPQYDNKGYFLFAGRLAREKGVDVLLKAMAQLPDIKLKIIGSDTEDNELKKLSAELKLNNVEFLGFKSGKELEEEYKNCIATILPSNYFETFGLTIIESFAYGKPVIGSNIGGIPEIIDDGENGILFEPGNSNQLARAINKLHLNNALSMKMGKNGRIKAEMKYNSEIYYSKLINAYNSVIRGIK